MGQIISKDLVKEWYIMMRVVEASKARLLKIRGKIFKKYKKYPIKMNCDYRADGFGTRGKSLKFMESTLFNDAWDFTAEVAKIGWEGGVPDIQWRTHVAIWAAQNALRIEGDFVELGVHTGILSLALCKFHNFGSLKDRKFWLFDTWAGIPLEGLSTNDTVMAAEFNSTIYKKDIFSAVEQAFSIFPNCHLIRGVLPGSFKDADIKKIAYLSIDLNNAAAEKACIEVLWPQLTPGAFVVLDDYGWKTHKDQQDMWDDFAASKDRIILTLPTGQGLLVK